MKPALLVIAGPNGSGKTTVTVRLREERWSDGVEYLNASDVARDRFGGLLRKVYATLPEWVTEATTSLARHPDFADMRAA